MLPTLYRQIDMSSDTVTLDAIHLSEYYTLTMLAVQFGAETIFYLSGKKMEWLVPTAHAGYQLKLGVQLPPDMGRAPWRTSTLLHPTIRRPKRM